MPEETNIPRWYVMRVFQNHRGAEEKLLSPTHGLSHFIPKQEVIRIRHGKKIICQEPVIRSLIFVHATREEILTFKQNYYNELQFVSNRTIDGIKYLTVPDRDMDQFIRLYHARYDRITFYQPSEVHIEKGKRVRVHGGPLDTLEGYFVKVAHKRNKQFVILIPDTLAISAQVEEGIIEVID